ncbi:MAG TPA: MauE/DoxX family redox-associated membrane protein [Caulobacteraceae bacterium]|nr:MauE/DoxX family redox-associated membrane protein [Caulobacteraceae bacterium]
MAHGLEVFALTGRLLAALILLRSGLAKLRDPAGFEAALGAYRLLPDAVVAPLSRSLPWLELTLAPCLFVPLAAGVGEAASAALFVAFAVAMAVSLLRGLRDIDCGCGGVRQPLSWRLVAQNLGIACGLVCAAIIPAPFVMAGLGVAVAAAAGLFLALAAAESLAAASPRKLTA